jgi:DNA-binding NarL/FixJ family response regulator
MTLLVADHTGGLADGVAGAVRRTSADDAVAAVATLRPAAVLVHDALPPEGGVALAVRLAPRRVPVVLALARPSAGTLAAALRAGVRAIVDADTGPRSLGLALEAAARGDLLVAGGASAALRELTHRGHAAFPALSPREYDVLARLAAGADPGRVATQLGLSPKTVRHHVRGIQRKLGAGDHVEAARLARAAGVCPGAP